MRTAALFERTLALKVTYDADRDGLRILFNDTPIERTDDAAPGLLLDFDANGSVVGLEISEASRRMHNPRVVEVIEHHAGGATENASAVTSATE